MNISYFKWTDERVEFLKKRHDEGFSFGMIARDLGTTRNAVIGKAHRLNLAGRERPVKERRLRPPRSKMWRAGRAPWVPQNKVGDAVLPLSIIPTDPKTLMQLGPHHCRWILGEPNHDALYCGSPRKDGSAYCEHHHAHTHTSARPIAREEAYLIAKLRRQAHREELAAA